MTTNLPDLPSMPDELARALRAGDKETADMGDLVQLDDHRPAPAQRWIDKFVPPRMTVRMPGGWGDPVTLIAGDQIVDGGHIEAILARLTDRFNAGAPAVWNFDLVAHGIRLVMRARPHGEAGDAIVDRQPLEETA